MSPRVAAGPEIGKHLARYRQIAGILADEGLHVVIDASGLRRVAPSRTKRVPDDHMTVEQHTRRAVERMGPTFIKVAQGISTRTDLISPALATELRKLQDDVPPEPFEAIRGVLETDLEAPLEELFASFEEEPFAAASLGQVHFAVLHDGTEVAVKIQRPNVRHQVEVDIDIALTQARWVKEHTDMFQDIDIVGVAEEYAEAVRHELDYTREASNAERFWRAFQDDDTVAFPKVFWEFTTSRVLVLERIVGVRLNRLDELDAAGLDRAQLAERGIRCYLHQMFELGFFHADAHPGNFIALVDGRIGFTDFGRVGRISEASRNRFIDLIWAAMNKDSQLAADTLVAVSGNPEIDEVELEREVGRLIGKYHGLELGGIEFGELLTETLGLIRDHRLGVPSDFALLIGTLGTLEGVGAMLDPKFDFATVAKPFADGVIRDRMRPEVVFNKAARSWRHTVRVMETMPDNLDRLMRRLSRGEMKVSARITGYEPIMTQLSELVNRLAFAIVVAALVMGFSSVLSRDEAPQWIHTAGRIGLLAAFVVSFWFFGSIMRDHFRGRRR